MPAKQVKGKKEEVVKKSKTQKEPEQKLKAHADLKWYVITVQTGHENAVSKALKQRIDATEASDMISEILVPVQKKIVVKEGKQHIKEEKIYPGYVIVKMVLNERVWELISSTEGVKGFVKTDKYPRPLPEREVLAIRNYMEVEKPEYQSSFKIREAVKIAEGAFADFIGSIQEIDEAKGKAKVLISFLGREAPVELDLSQIRKIS